MRGVLSSHFLGWPLESSIVARHFLGQLTAAAAGRHIARRRPIDPSSERADGRTDEWPANHRQHLWTTTTTQEIDNYPPTSELPILSLQSITHALEPALLAAVASCVLDLHAQLLLTLARDLHSWRRRRRPLRACSFCQPTYRTRQINLCERASERTTNQRTTTMCLIGGQRTSTNANQINLEAQLSARFWLLLESGPERRREKN